MASDSRTNGWMLDGSKALLEAICCPLGEGDAVTTMSPTQLQGTF